ncbi:hypothetical protein OOT55_15890 [Marinimicrobium sp. C6131]|uniref:hypothetical protein n=1 Tax=Marinimicrobium sp. C6131 TaxID=3022676 RepID=UPI00223E68EF|nr:hypothetical protein [Marinimicrobium sp. C6131]UZJ44122.1 hypothetical protein OOT55_15890 [Marinimicrobium sp. C6131]
MNDVRQNNDHPKIGVSDATLTWQNRNRSVVNSPPESARPACQFPAPRTMLGQGFLLFGTLFQIQKKTGALRRLKNRQWYSVNTGIKFSTDKADTATIRRTQRRSPAWKNFGKRNLTALSFAQKGRLIPIDIAVIHIALGASSSVNFFVKDPPSKP